MNEAFKKGASWVVGTLLLGSTAVADDQLLTKPQAAAALKNGNCIACFSDLGARVIDGTETDFFVISLMNPADSNVYEVMGRVRDNAFCYSAPTADELMKKLTPEHSLR
jgi:hypothetical protein